MGGCVDGVSGDVVGDFFPVRFTRLFFHFFKFSQSVANFEKFESKNL